MNEAFDPKNNSIGAIRLACALSVIIGHASPFGGYGDTFMMRLTNQQVSFARVAVDIFFVISGFLLAASCERSSLAGYLRNRFLRIYPGLWVCLIITGVLVPIAWGIPPSTDYIRTNAVMFFGSYLSIPGLFADNPHTVANGPLWTLRYELYCYVTLPIAMLMVRYWRYAAIIFLLGLWIAFAVTIGSTETLMDKSAIVSPFRLFTFFYAGVLFYVFRDKISIDIRSAVAAFVALAVTTAIGTVTFPHSGGLFYFIAPITLTYLVLYASVRLPLTRVNVETDLSYGLYIYGTFAVQVLVALGLNAESVNYWILALASVLVTLPVAYLSWRCVERPALSLRYGRQSAAATVGAP